MILSKFELTKIRQRSWKQIIFRQISSIEYEKMVSNISEFEGRIQRSWTDIKIIIPKHSDTSKIENSFFILFNIDG